VLEPNNERIVDSVYAAMKGEIEVPRGTSFYFQARGFALLEPWDEGDKIRQRSVLTHGQAQVWPMPAVGVLLGVS